MNVDIIRKKCEERNITVSEFEQAAGLASGIVSHWATMKYMPRYDSLQRAARFFGCDVSELVSEEDR